MQSFSPKEIAVRSRSRWRHGRNQFEFKEMKVNEINLRATSHLLWARQHGFSRGQSSGMTGKGDSRKLAEKPIKSWHPGGQCAALYRVSARLAPQERRIAVIPMTARRYGLFWLMSFALLVFGQASRPAIPKIESLLRDRHPAQAMPLLNAALRSSPSNSNLWTLKGIALSMQGKDAGASTAFQHALRLNPDNLAALRGEVQLFDQKHNHHAVPLLRRILALSPHDGIAHEMLAVYEQRDGDCKAAIADFRQSGTAIKRHPESLASYGICLNDIGDTRESISVFQELTNRFPQLVFARYDLALLFYDAKHYHKALQALQPIMKAAQTNTDVLALASSAYEAVGNTPKAVATLRQAIIQARHNVNLYNVFARLCLDHQSYKAGIEMLNAGIHFNPQAASLYISRGLLYAELSNFSKARADFATADRLNSKQSVGSYSIDIAELEKFHFDRKHSDSMVQLLHLQLKIYPHSYLLNFLLAKLLTMQSSSHESRHFVHAKDAAQAAVRLKPDFVPARDLLAQIDLDSGDFSGAAKESRKALQYAPNDRPAVYHLILALRHSNLPQDHRELRVMLKRIATMESASTLKARHKKQFRLVEAPRPQR